MAYVICEKCGGYYELQEGESSDDFDSCHCGGNLSYVRSIQKEIKKPKNTIKCGICGHEQEKNFKCSKCGSKIRLKVNHRNNNYRKGHYRYVGEKELFDRIEWSGVKSGVIFYIGAIIFMSIISFIFYGFLGVTALSGAQNTNVGLISVFGVIGAVFSLIYVLIPVISGFWAVASITTDDYVTGMVNGGAVGVILGIIGIFLALFFGATTMLVTNQVNMGIITVLILIITTMITRTVSTAAGGLIAVYVRRHTSYI